MPVSLRPWMSAHCTVRIVSWCRLWSASLRSRTAVTFCTSASSLAESSRKVARSFVVFGPAPLVTSMPADEVIAAAVAWPMSSSSVRLSGRKVVAGPDAIASFFLVEEPGNTRQLQDGQVAEDRPLGTFQLGGDVPDAMAAPSLDQLQHAEDSREFGGLAESSVGIRSFGAVFLGHRFCKSSR